jgi:bacterioferritin-associated ferredoxin
MAKDQVKTVHAGVPGGDEVSLTLFLTESGDIKKSEWRVTGSLEMIEEAQNLKNKMKGPLASAPLPEGFSFQKLLLKELLLKAREEWPGEDEQELCHCRNVPQKIVERAILLGAHSVEKVRQRTSANTGCGTCLPDVERLLKLYLK